MTRIHEALGIALCMIAVAAGSPGTQPPVANDGDAGKPIAVPAQNGSPVAASPAPSAEPVDARPMAVRIRRTEPATVVFSEYAGPYWGVGPVLRRVRVDMAKAQKDGATFVRFPTDPRGETIVPAATLVGYFAKPGVSPGPSYAVEHWKPMLVASTTIRGPNTGTTALYPIMRTWAKEHGYDMVGPIIEVYKPTQPGAPVDEQQTEIQIPIRRSVVSTKPLPRASAPEPVKVGQVVRPRTPGGSPASTMGGQPSALERKNDLPYRFPLPQVLSRTGGAGKPDPEIAARNAKGSMRPFSLPSEVDGTHPDEPTFEALVVLGRYDEAFALTWPVGTRIDEASRRWLDQLDARVRALAVALSNRDDQAARDVSVIADALHQTVSRLSDGSNDTKDSEARTIGVIGGPVDREQARDVIAYLDRLMVRVGQQSVDASQCLTELRRMMVRVHRLLHREGRTN